MFVHIIGRRGPQLGYDLVLQVGEDASSLVEVARCGLEAVRVVAVAADGQLRVEGGQVVYNVGSLELEVVVDDGSVDVVSQRRIPGKVGAYLSRRAIVLAPNSPQAPGVWLKEAAWEREGRRTSMGNFPAIQTSWAAYAWSFLMPLG